MAGRMGKWPSPPAQPDPSTAASDSDEEQLSGSSEHAQPSVRSRRRGRPHQRQLSSALKVRGAEQIMRHCTTPPGLESDSTHLNPATPDALLHVVVEKMFWYTPGRNHYSSAWHTIVTEWYDELAVNVSRSLVGLRSSVMPDGTIVLQDSPESLRGHYRSMQLLNNKLDDPRQHRCIEMVNSIAGLLVHDRFIGAFETFNKHMAGLQQIIKIRGGYSTLPVYLRLALGLVDLTGAYSQDRRPCHPPLESWIFAPDSQTKNDLPKPVPSSLISTISRQVLPQPSEWTYILEDTRYFIGKPDIPVTDWVEPILHRLLTLRPGHASREHLNEDVCRIGLLLFLAPIWRTFAPPPVRTKALRRNLRILLETQCIQWGDSKVLLIWTLFHAALESTDPAERRGFVLLLASLMDSANIATWQSLMYLVKGVIWLEGLSVEGDDTFRAIVIQCLRAIRVSHTAARASEVDRLLQASGSSHSPSSGLIPLRVKKSKPESS